MKRIPISYIVKAQALYVRVFEIEDSYQIESDEIYELRAKRKAMEDYVDKMFFDDEEALHMFYNWMNTGIIRSGTHKDICDALRAKGYVILSKDNATKAEMKECEKECLEKWKEWKKHEHK